MRARLRTAVSWLRPVAAWIGWRFGPRDLRREVAQQSTERYWRRRVRARSRRLWFVEHRYRFSSLINRVRHRAGIVRSTLLGLLRAVALGGVLIAAVLTIEQALIHYFTLPLVPGTETPPPMGAFPTLAVQVSASLLGFYLASVSIVLGTSYHNVPAEVRKLVLENARTRLYLASIGSSIGAGLALMLLRSLGGTFGYLPLIAYALLVVFSGWAFIRLAFGAFYLFDPLELSEEPLRTLDQAIDQFGSKGLLGDQAVLQARSQDANRALGILDHLINLTSERASVDKKDLARMVERLLACVQSYAVRKHLLAPTSAWFRPEPAYPRWVESDYSAMIIALRTSTPLPPPASSRSQTGSKSDLPSSPSQRSRYVLRQMIATQRS